MDNLTTTTNKPSIISTDWLSQYQMEMFAKSTQIDATLTQSDVPLIYAVSAAGLPANALILLTTAAKSTTFNKLFRWTMIATSILDFLYLLLKVLRVLARVYWNAILMYQILSGVMYVFSLMSDLLTLTLTVDRFVGMVFPVFYQNLHRRTKRCVWTITICILVLISATRLHYTFTSYYFVSFIAVDSPWFVAMTYFSDTVVPFLLLIITVALVFAMVIVLRKRFNEQRKNPGMENIAKERIKDMRKTTSLMMSLLFLCFLNQVGYVYYQVCFTLNQQCGLTTFTTETEIYKCYVVKVAYSLSARLSLNFENISKAANFYFYIVFNKTFRRSFLAIFVRCRPVGTSTVSNII